jgi:hypothetical protein
VDVLARLTLACGVVFVADAVVFIASWGTCVDNAEGCSGWRETMNLITFLGIPLLGGLFAFGLGLLFRGARTSDGGGV